MTGSGCTRKNASALDPGCEPAKVRLDPVPTLATAAKFTEPPMYDAHKQHANCLSIMPCMTHQSTLGY